MVTFFELDPETIDAVKKCLDNFFQGPLEGQALV
jgi:hypothetical protein